MFNFGDPPANLRNIRSRISFSDTGLTRTQQKNSSVPAPFDDESTEGRGRDADPVTLPPLKASRSSPQVPGAAKSASQSQFPRKLLPHHHIPQPHYVPQHPLAHPEGRKLPSHREMIYLTLKHVHSARGLTFDQIYSFVSGAFEIPRSFTLESKLRKTLSNMQSKGVVLQNPGLEPRYITYQLRHMEPESNLDLSVSGKSVPQVTCWPNSFNLPNGCDLLCRTGSIRKELPPRLSFPKQAYRRNPMTMRLQPMTIGDPMICQSFGARAGLQFKKSEPRPSSPNDGDEDGDDDEGANPADYLNYCERQWISEVGTNNNNNNYSDQPASSMMNRNVNKSPPPRVLNTYNPSDQGCQTQQQYEQHDVQCSPEDDEGQDGEEEEEEELKMEATASGTCNAGTQSSSIPPERMFTATRHSESYTTWSSSYNNNNNNNNNNTNHHQKHVENEPLSDFDIFANYNGETYQEYEMNNRSCHIMNDLSRSRALLAVDEEREKEMMSPKLNGADRMDYLLGIADIIDSYGEEPPELTKSGKRSRPTAAAPPAALSPSLLSSSTTTSSSKQVKGAGIHRRF